MKTTLDKCLKAYSSDLGENFDLLGKASGFLGLGKKVYLSYSKDKGWDVHKLNYVQRIFRNLFGVYKNTHLNLISKKITKELPNKDTQQCFSKIVACWSKNNISLQGNCDVQTAKVIGFPERHGDNRYRAAAAQIIQEHYQKGDVILVEGLVAGKKTKTVNISLTKFLAPDLKARGWEPLNYDEFRGPASLISSQKSDELIKIIDEFKPLMKKESFSEEELVSFESQVNMLISKIEELNQYYESKNTLIVKAADTFKNAYERLKEDVHSKKLMPGLSFLLAVVLIIIEFEKAREKAYLRNLRKEEISLDSFNIRNATLVSEIQKYRDKGKRVFVFAGAAHLLNFKGLSNCQDVRDCLEKDTYALVTKKNGYF